MALSRRSRRFTIDFHLTRGEISPMAGVPVRVLIADDEQLAAAATIAALDSGDGFDRVGVARSAAAAAQLAYAERPHVALVHAALPGGGDAAVRAVRQASPGTRVLVHAAPSDRDALIAALRAGASGYVVRDTPAAELATALRGAAAGDLIFDGVVDQGVLRELMGQVHEASRVEEARITKRARILRVIDELQLEVLFQPIVALDSREVVGYEALSRFAAAPRRGPEAWFAEAHEVGLGPELEMMACERSHALPSGTFMAVNVSPATAEQPELLDLLDGCGVDHVVLEVTEHARVEDYPSFRVAIQRVREHGASLAVDDAGAGFSSLRHILELDAELIKLDGSLTQSLEADPRRRSLASALIEFGRESGASVLAEHIESELQLIELRRLGVHYGQGYHLGRPQRLPVTV
jgi:EAL domain-containing protein (putative c-di-GMP-specific phosphodiesterase class I)/CheY-like chemotaxis protein